MLNYHYCANLNTPNVPLLVPLPPIVTSLLPSGVTKICSTDCEAERKVYGICGRPAAAVTSGRGWVAAVPFWSHSQTPLLIYSCIYKFVCFFKKENTRWRAPFFWTSRRCGNSRPPCSQRRRLFVLYCTHTLDDINRELRFVAPRTGKQAYGSLALLYIRKNKKDKLP